MAKMPAGTISQRLFLLLFCAVVAGALACAHAFASQDPDRWAVVGRWDITVKAAGRDYPSWIEIKRSGNETLVGQFVGQSGSARPVSKVEFSGGQLRFSLPPQWERRRTDVLFEGKLQQDTLSGWTTDADGNRLQWTARRAPSLRRSDKPNWDPPSLLFNGSDLSGWHCTGTNEWRVVDGVLTNGKAGGNLVTDRTFSDFKIHVEFRYPKGGNSGVYLRGRYEVQIEDSGGQEPATDHLGAVYGFLSPSEDAAKKPGEWQTYDITLIGRMVTVVLNGKTIICNREVPGITGGALDSDESAPGPIFLQGDHGPIEFRKIKIVSAR